MDELTIAIGAAAIIAIGLIAKAPLLDIAIAVLYIISILLLKNNEDFRHGFFSTF